MASGFSIDSNTADDHDFTCMESSSKRARMSCGHTVTLESLLEWCERQIEEGKGNFHCGVCDAKWPFDEVSKLVSEKQGTVFDEKLFKNTFRQIQVKSCPGCKYYVKRRDTNNLSVQCLKCTTEKGRCYEFCWQCEREWKGRRPRSDRCDNDGCTNEALDLLRICKDIEFKHSGLNGIKGCPSVRACPTCGFVVGHNREMCKNIVCPDCKKEFCFVCLKITPECLKTSTHFTLCSDGVAPRQTSIPVGKK